MACFRNRHIEPLRPLALIVSDDPAVRSLVGMQMRIWEYDVIEFGAADTALAFVHAHPEAIGFVYTEAQIGGLPKGADLAKTLGRAFPEIPVLVSSWPAACKDGELPPSCTLLPKPWLPGEFLKQATQMATRPMPVAAVTRLPASASLALH